MLVATTQTCNSHNASVSAGVPVPFQIHYGQGWELWCGDHCCDRHII